MANNYNVALLVGITGHCAKCRILNVAKVEDYLEMKTK
jgi:hypothetical protein